MTDSEDVLWKKLRPEKRDALAGEVESGDVDDVEGAGELDDGVKAVLMRRRELRGWRGWNLVDGMVVLVMWRRGAWPSACFARLCSDAKVFRRL